MQVVQVLGAGKSAFCCIEYLAGISSKVQVKVADASAEALENISSFFPNVLTMKLDASDKGLLNLMVAGADVVISLLPASWHPEVAALCLANGKHLLTPSYISAEMQELGPAAKEKGLIFLNELGLDPGIDHMSALKMIRSLQANEEIKIVGFESHCGGLIAADDKDNPWRYKFTWNPANVISAGRDGAVFLEHSNIRFYPYHKLFALSETVSVNGEPLSMYYNRDSLHYIDLYNLKGIENFARGTLRYAPYARAWACLVEFGLTSNSQSIPVQPGATWADFAAGIVGVEKAQLAETLSDFAAQEKENVLPLLSYLANLDTPLVGEQLTPAAALQQVLEPAWALKAGDTDRVVMLHKLTYMQGGQRCIHEAVLDIAGIDDTRTAMAQTVGWPLAIAAEMIVDGMIKERGVLLPLSPEIYLPMLDLLDKLGVSFTERTYNAPN